MLNLARPLRPEDYIAIAWRRRWWIIIPFVLVSTAGILLTFHLPKVYRSSTRILLISQRVPEDYIRPTVTASIEERVYSVSLQITSRTNLSKIIDEFDLYGEYVGKTREEEVIERMRKDIDVKVKDPGRGRGGGAAFEVFYAGDDPERVMMVTNRLASLFIEQHLRIRERQARGTAEFLGDQLRQVKAELESQERSLTAFKLKNMGELPEQMEANLRVLEQLQLQSQRVSDGLRSAEHRRTMLMSQVSLPDSNLTGSSPSTIETLYAELRVLKSKYTDNHPDVIMMKKRIKEVEELGRSQGAMIPETNQTRPSYILGRQNQVVELDDEIRRLREQERKIQSKIKEYEKRIEVTPKREQELISVTRDYENTKELYQSLLTKKLEAEQAKTMEERQKGEQFLIIDPAQLPTVPWKPNIRKLCLLSVALGLGVGCGLASLAEYRDRSFKDPEDLQAFTGVSVLAVVPRIELDDDGRVKEKSSSALKHTASL